MKDSNSHAGSPLVWVLVINWNGKEHLEACFESLLESDYPNFRAVLLDNASSDGSVAFFRERFGEDPRADVIECSTNLGWSGGNNVGMEQALAAGAEYILLLNNDTAIAPDAISILVNASESDAKVGALAPKMLMFYTPEILNSVGVEGSVVGCAWDRGIGRLDGPSWDTPERVLAACGGAACFRTETLRKTGLLPNEFEIYLDDVDLCLRVWRAGYDVRTCPSARVRHKFSATMGEGARAKRKYYLMTRNRLYLVGRNFPVRRFGSVLLAFVRGELKSVGRALLDGELWRVGAHLRAWFAGLAYLPRAVGARRATQFPKETEDSFWPLIKRAPLFFPGTEFPRDGWYAPRQGAPAGWRPMSATAWLETSGGRLRVHAMNCYPHLGVSVVDVLIGGAVVQTLRAGQQVVSAECDMPRGRVEFRARRIFPAEATGERIDIGGWLNVEAVE